MEAGSLGSLKREKPVKAENVFLMLAVFFGLIFSFVQPLFNEPDSSYHFDHSMYISNTVVDRSAIGFSGEDYQSHPIPFTKVSDMKADGTYFKKFFETKLPLIHKKDADPRVSRGYGTEWNITWYNDIMHIVPALGVKLGYAIYPSIGSMVITARLFSLIFFVLSMYFIIKKLKVYKYIFVAISVTPTVIQHASSLSYDVYNYVACAFMIMTAINLAVDIKNGQEVTISTFFLKILPPSGVLYFAKINSQLLYLIIPGMLLYFVNKKFKFHLSKLQLTIGCCIFLVLGSGIFYVIFSGQLVMIFIKMFYSLIEPYYTVLSTEIISGTTTVAVPSWFFGVQMVVLVLLFLSYNKEVVPRWFAWGSFSLVCLNFLAIMVSYAVDPAFVDYAGRIITGAQGRYFTPFLLLLAPVFTLLAQKITVKSDTWLIRLFIIMSVCALVLNLGITSLKFYHLQLPADEWRSGIHHYIFK
ncbi:DUF2142 domain-containing protein [Lactococcus garvieae]|nr:DUF2142 domain-containing protein [Lactococcus garvieae]